MADKRTLPPVPEAVTDRQLRAFLEDLRVRFDRLVALDAGTATTAQVVKALTRED